MPCVNVPVLSKTMYFIPLSFSKVSPPFTSTPLRADRPIPTATAVGVANPMAQGQEMTNTAILLNNDSEMGKLK